MIEDGLWGIISKMEVDPGAAHTEAHILTTVITK